MSDYQQVQVLEVRGRVVVLDVVEDHPDMDAFASIVDGASLRTDDAAGVAKIAAELVLERNGCDNAMCAWAIRTHDETDRWPTPEAFVAGMTLRAVEELGPSSADQPRYHAVVAIELTQEEFAREFEVGESWGAVATPTDQDVELIDFWDHVG